MKIEIIADDDWQGLYLDGTLRIQGDSISIIDVLHALDINYSQQVVDREWLDEHGYFPNQLAQIPLKLRKETTTIVK